MMVDQTLETVEHKEKTQGQRMSFQNYLTQYDGQYAEWLVDRVEVHVANNVPHQVLLGFLHTILSLYLGFRPIGKVLLAGVAMFIDEDTPARQPDLLIIFNENLERVQENHLHGPADIAVEIISPESSKRDRGDKFDEYEAAGVREYWLFDPVRQEARIYALNAEGHYNPVSLDEEGRLVSTLLPGFALGPEGLWREEPPQGEALITLARAMAGA
jgi:Uma2 family endonuclease